LFQKNTKVLVVTGCDESHYDLADDCIASFHECYPGACDIGFVHFGEGLPPAAIAGQVTHNLALPPPAEFARAEGYFAAFAGIKASLPELFPGYEMYIWIDSDCWFQNATSLPRIIAMMQASNIAIHPEFDVHYAHYPTPTERTVYIYTRNEGNDLSAMPLNMPMLNAGVFGMRANSPLWGAWRRELARLMERFRRGQDVFFSDQIALHKVIFSNNYSFGPLRAIDNWQTYACLPHVNLASRKLVVPSSPFEEIGIVHLAGQSKFERMEMNGLRFGLRYGEFRRAGVEV
jgi:hypothetical protein